MSKVIGKITGATAQAKAVERAAAQQAEATRKSSEAAAAATRESAAQAARQQEAAVARNAATAAAAEQLSKPLETAEVQLDEAPTESASGAARKRRQQFGIGSVGTGVQI